MTDKKLSEITKIPLSTINGYKKSDDYRLLLYNILKKIPNLESLYEEVIEEQKSKKNIKWTIKDLFDGVSKLKEFDDYDFFIKGSEPYGPLGNGKSLMPLFFDFYATDSNNNLVLFDFRPTILYGIKLEDVIDRIHNSVGIDNFNSIKVCFLTYKSEKRKINEKYDFLIKSVSEVLKIDSENLSLKGIY